MSLRTIEYATNTYKKYFYTFRINQVIFTYGERKKERPNFDRMFSQNLPISAAFIAILKMKLPQCKAIGVRTPPGVRRTSPFGLQISRLVSRDFWCKQSAKVQTLSPVRSICVGSFSNITSHFREAFPPSKLSSFFYHIFECLSSKFLFRCRRSRCEECYRMRCGME